MTHATVYSKPSCHLCSSAKLLLSYNDIEYDEIIIDVGQPKLKGQAYIDVAELRAKHPEVKSVPQVFIDGRRIGGYAELKKYLSRAA
jgi:glutaredoxin